MTTDLARITDVLGRRYLREHPASAARRLEEMSVDDALDELSTLPAAPLIPVWPSFAADRGAELMARMSGSIARELLTGMLPTDAVRFLSAMEDESRQRVLDSLDPELRTQLIQLMTYPEDSAGRLMATRILVFRPAMTAAQALERLRAARLRAARSLFVVDGENRLTGQVPITELAMASPDTVLGEISQPIVAVVNAMDPREDVVQTVEKHRMAELPVIDLDGRLIGLILPGTLVQALQEEAAADIGAMVGVSPQERALSTAWFAVRKRLPWLQINLLTAFLAASVVGLFEGTIAKFTALAVLMPVVAGQAGNTGAQALAVTMRGLALREVTARQWFAVSSKEIGVGLMNGVAVAVTCGAAVFVWSHSLGLVMVISISMVLAMILAGFAGALVPMILTRLGMDPAQSSSIILTTVTDVSGFFSFLGIATLMSSMLQAG